MIQCKKYFDKYGNGRILFMPALVIISMFTMSYRYLHLNAFVNVEDHRITIPVGGNTWPSARGNEGGQVTNDGIVKWSDKNVTFHSYVRLTQKGVIKLWLQLNNPKGQSTLRVTINGITKQIKAAGAETKEYYAGDWNISDTGYIVIHLEGIAKTGDIFGNIRNIILEHSSVNNQAAYVKNNDGNFFYWGRRGPSVHINYVLPEDVHAEWFYNEVTVPEGNDVLGSYFMADGFAEGYFGMQVNSPTSRHILFSVWSPFSTDDPKKIPDSMKIQLLGKGTQVHAGEFGHEGSGGQSYLNYIWKTGVTYRFLLHGVPDGTDHTLYTAYFYAPEKERWLLIASFKRPKTNTWLKHLHSFLENFSPDQGDKERRVLFGNQWICTDKGRWIELNKMRFTTDNTGRKGYRMDYAGGVDGGKFYLRNCGFFNDYTPPGSRFERPPAAKRPTIDFNTLPAR
jgi:hypothetical protein